MLEQSATYWLADRSEGNGTQCSAPRATRTFGRAGCNAIPLELLKADQDRITTQEAAAKAELEHTEADLEGWQEVLGLAIRLTGNCHAAYLKANPTVRHRFNDAVLESVYIKVGKVSRAEFTEVFQALFSRPGSNEALSVGGTGIEPVTSSV